MLAVEQPKFVHGCNRGPRRALQYQMRRGDGHHCGTFTGLADGARAASSHQAIPSGGEKHEPNWA